MMRLLIDQGLPWSTAGILRDVGIDTVHVSEIGAAVTVQADRVRVRLLPLVK